MFDKNDFVSLVYHKSFKDLCKEVFGISHWSTRNREQFDYHQVPFALDDGAELIFALVFVIPDNRQFIVLRCERPLNDPFRLATPHEYQQFMGLRNGHK